MKKLNLREIKREIKADKHTANDKDWWLESIEEVETVEAADGMANTYTAYEVVIGFPASRHEDNGQKFKVCHFEDVDCYAVYYEGTCFF